MKTEREKMISGDVYLPSDMELQTLRQTAHKLSSQYNSLDENDAERPKILQKLLGPSSDEIYVQGPIQFDYGVNTTVGTGFFANFNFTVLDCAPVTIGDNVMIGPNVSLLTALHPIRYQDRNVRRNSAGEVVIYESSAPITIDDNCWIAGDVTIVGGVHIGEGSVIGAGSVVTRDIPANVIAVGNPCRVLRDITEADRVDLPE